MPRDLVIARCGASSLHPGWLRGGDADDPGWDLHLIPYQPLPDELTAGCVVHDVVPGPKWTGLRVLLNAWDGWRDYDRVWLPDDDLAASAATITRLFAAARAADLRLFAPALTGDSWFAHFDTVRNPRFFGRRTGFVEIMAPGFRADTLAEVLPTLDESATGWGWGLDSVWPKLLGYEGVGVVDGAPVHHTRPVGVMRDEDLRARVHAESDALLARYDCGQVHATFGAFGPDGAAIPMTPEALLAELVAGWQPLIARDPRVLGWIAEFQRAHFAPPPYPVEGTPVVPEASAAAAA